MSKLLTTKQLAEALQTHEQTIRRWVKSGKIKPRIMVGREPRFCRGDVMAALSIKTKESKNDTTK